MIYTQNIVANEKHSTHLNTIREYPAKKALVMEKEKLSNYHLSIIFVTNVAHLKSSNA